MRSLIKQFALRDVVLIAGVAALVTLITVRVSPSTTSVVSLPDAEPSKSTADENAAVNHNGHVKLIGRNALTHAQDDLYERRRRYWEDRVERRIDEEEGLDDEDKADSTDKKDKTGKKDKAKKGDDDEDSLDQEEELIERRREQWRKRVEDEW